MQRSGAWCAGLILLYLSISMQSVPAFAQMEQPQPLTTPIADEWRAPFATFLQSMGVKNPDSLVAKTLGFPIGRFWQEGAILLRVEDSTLCSRDICFTVIGRIRNSTFVPDSMFGAGKNVTSSDNFEHVLGFQTLAWYLVSKNLSVTLRETPQGWIVTSHIGESP